METFTIHIMGLVQGVGFRPFIYRIATELGLSGEVENRNDGVLITINCDSDELNKLVSLIHSGAPPASRIDKLVSDHIEKVNFTKFSIRKSENISDEITGVSPDIAVCNDCLSDMKSQDHRVDFPFINCTNCGPRYTIIKDLPYDRAKTTMSDFLMCDQCSQEYKDITDRRFHAQPVACNRCGPVYSLFDGVKEVEGNIIALDALAKTINNGGIVALKGVGGYHLLCDANRELTVQLLRKRKIREGKPFAVMSENLEKAKRIAYIDRDEAKLLTSWQRPVVILKSRMKLAQSVSNKLNSIGVILPYMPIHYLLFEKLPGITLVFTSANLSEEPVVKSNHEAREKLIGIADLVVTYNRKIYNRVDDSVATVFSGKTSMVRRSRGYAPSPVKIVHDCEGIFAAGAELTNTFSIGKGRDAIISQYIGDLKTQATYEFYKETFKILRRLFRFTPSLVVSDLHPDYLSTGFATNLSERFDLPVVEVQHHHAHIASCMAENSVSDQVIGIALDGVGLGSDANIWGGEIMIADFVSFERRYHFDYVPIVGADRVSNEPWRSALSYIIKYIEDDGVIGRLDSLKELTPEEISMYRHALSKGVNSHNYSSAGRLFDAVAVICGVKGVSQFHAEAPMRLEAMATKRIEEYYGYEIEGDIISFKKTIRLIINDIIGGMSGAEVSSKFHNTIIRSLFDVIEKLSLDTGLKRVALSGGSFQNRFLTSGLTDLLERKKYQVYLHSEVPPNDGGISLGQMAVAAAKRSLSGITKS